MGDEVMRHYMVTFRVDGHSTVETVAQAGHDAVDAVQLALIGAILKYGCSAEIVSTPEPFDSAAKPLPWELGVK